MTEKKKTAGDGGLKATIDGRVIQVMAGETILDLARREGVRIPTLCHDPRLKPTGACRLCLVEVEGEAQLVPACATEITSGMVVKTNTDSIREIRRTLLELLLSDHPTDCLTCEKCGDCILQDYAYEYGARQNGYQGAKHAIVEQKPDPFIAREMSKCIMCGRCVRICDEVEAAFAVDWSGRGFDLGVGAPFGRSLKETPCEFCGQCISTCPTGALTEKPSLGKMRSWEGEKTRTICPYCGVGCTLELLTKDNEIVSVKSPLGVGTNKGNLCVKGRFGYHFVASPERLTKPLLKKDGRFVEIGWDEALKIAADKLGSIKAKFGPDAIAGLASAKCTNEENYVFQKFMRAVLDTNNVDHCARLCHASTVAGLAIAFGSGAMSNSISDLESTEAFLVIGSNTTEAHPVIGMSLLKAVRQNGAKLVVVDPRGIKLTKFADIWLAQKPGTDVAVLNGLMHVILEEGLLDRDFIAERTEGFADLEAALPAFTPERVEEISGVPAPDLRRAARLFAGAGKACIVYSMGITQHTTGVDNVLAVANLAMMTGNIGRPGTGVSPLRGQNNVQGSCDMGALPGVYSGYQKVDDPEVAAKMAAAWGVVDLPEKPGLTVVEIMGAAAQGRMKALYIMGENPMLSDPDTAHVEEALEKLDFLIVQDIFLTETAAMADLVLPGLAFAEREGTFTSTERRIQLVRKAVEPKGEAKEDWRIICDLAAALGFPMSYDSAAEIMREIASVTPAFAGITYDRLEKDGLQWPCPSLDHPGTPMLHVDRFTRGKGKFHAVDFRPPAEEPDPAFPLVLTTGRVLTQYHTGTMIRRSAGIDEISSVGAAEISPKDAKKYGLNTGDRVRLTTRRGEIEALALITDRSRPGVVFMPFHYKEAAANKLTNPALDPVAKIPEFKVCALRLEKL